MTIATSTLAEQRTLLENISWSTFTTLLRETGENRGSRFAYDGYRLEIMTPLYEHESYNIQFDRFIFALAEELNVIIKSARSMTLKREDVGKGIEPDNCYYIQNEVAVRGKREIDLAKDPSPDLAIEVDITSSSVDKLQIYAALRVPELWRYNGRVLRFYQLGETGYIECDRSLAFPILLVTEMAKFIEQSKTIDEITLVRSFRAWVREKI